MIESLDTLIGEGEVIRLAKPEDKEQLTNFANKFLVKLYGDQSNETNTIGDDRPLPNELHCRINRMTADWAPIYVQQFIVNYNTMNAFIRDELYITKQNE